jgi:hypothetical protein
MPLDSPLAGLNTLYGISLPASLEGMVPLTPSGSTIGLGSGVFPSHLNLRYSGAPTYMYNSISIQCVGRGMVR